MLRGDGLLRMLGRRPQGRPRMRMLDGLKEIDMKAGKKKKESFESMKRSAEDRQGWRVFVAEGLPEGRKLMMMMIQIQIQKCLRQFHRGEDSVGDVLVKTEESCCPTQQSCQQS